MRLAVISERGWKLHAEAALSLLAGLPPHPGHNCVVIDWAAVRTHAQSETARAEALHSEVRLEAWLKPGAVEDSVIDNHSIRAATTSLPLDRPVILDGSGHRFELIAAALRQCRHAWFPLDDWHPAFAVVCDETSLLPLADALANTFYCQPVSISERDLNRLVSDHLSRAFIFRWFGYTTGRYTRAIAVRVRRLRLAVEARLRNI